MTFPEEHFKETKRLLSKIDPLKIASWLLQEGYFAEQYVLPPNFKVEKFALRRSPFFSVRTRGRTEFNPELSEPISISFPKSRLTERTLGIIDPKIYHDIVWYISAEWPLILEHLFHKTIRIYSYSFPIPITSKAESELGELRAGRMIYEFLEMAENDMVAEAYQYKYLVKTDVKNCYPSIYTHSIPWALHGKKKARTDKGTYSLLGSKLDRLFQCANDGCTNGIPIGSAVSDLIAEIILAGVDKDVSVDLESLGIEFLGVRFKDDYRFLCNSKTDAERIIKSLQKHLKNYNLSLNEKKSEIKGLPEGLFRQWVADYNSSSLRYKRQIPYKRFEHTLLTVLKIDQDHPDTGIIDRFLSELTTKKHNLKLNIHSKDIFKTFSLLLLLKERRAKSFPQILAIIELLFFTFKDDKGLIAKMTSSIESIFNNKLENISDNCYDLIWLAYFIKSNELFTISWPKKLPHPFLKSIKANNQNFFVTPDIKLYVSIKRVGKNLPLIKHVSIFKKNTEPL